MLVLIGSRRQAALAFIFVTAVLDIVAMGIIIPVLPSLIEEFAGSNAAAGWINGVFVALWAGMQFVASPVIGSLSDHYGRRPVVLLSTAGLAADYVLMAVAPICGGWRSAASLPGSRRRASPPYSPTWPTSPHRRRPTRASLPLFK